ncbi:MAG: MMPL family transporter [Thermoleophilia bacterium]|nr:MMPL family transporter [Thermoleophilia bacterium]
MEHTNFAGRAGRWSAAHWKTATFGWLAVGVAAVAVGMAVGKVELTDSESASGETAKAESILEHAGFNTPATESVLVQSKTATAKDEAFSSAVASVVQTISGLANVTNIQNPLDSRQNGLVSRDGHSALIQFDIKGQAKDSDTKVKPMLDAVEQAQAGNPSFVIEEFGQASANHVLNDAFTQDLQRAEYTSLPLTLIILFLAFGALVAAGLPVLLAFTAVLAATGFNSIVSHVVHTSNATTSVILMIGLAVGVDYSLFYLKREREERAGGNSPHDSLLRTARTSGQAVLISGATVLIAMAGMMFAGNAVFTTIGLGTIIVVAAAIVASLTVLPALMHRLGDKVNAGRLPFLGRRRGEERIWGAIVGAVLKRPGISLAVSTAVLIVLTLPALSLHTKLPSFTDLPHSLKIVRTFDRMQAAFPGAQTPAELVVKADDVTTPRYQRAYRDFRDRALATGQLFRPFHVFVSPDKTVARVEFSIAGSGDDATSQRALAVLRGSVIPPVARTLPGVAYGVTGVTAGTHDFNARMKSRLPIVFAFVLGLAFILLLLTFRSIVIPAKAVLLNLLSVGAAYGILVAVFQNSWAEGLLGFKSNHSIASWLPLFLFVVLFGLSMDYHVFILSRVKELHDAGESTADAVRHAITRTAGTVTSAAIIMVGVFGLFATVREIDIKQMGFGLAVAVLIDATIIRAVLLPSAMKLLGEWNWYLPSWLEWLPSLAPEGEAEEGPEGPAVIPV